MKETPNGTGVGVDDPFSMVDRCDWVTDDGRCRFALERPEADPAFSQARRAEDYACPFAAEGAWDECDHFRSRASGRRCVRCGLSERRRAHDDDSRPLLHEHHLSYEHADETEITVLVCRWCHAKIHRSGARLDDEVDPDPDALETLTMRRQREAEEASFETAAKRYLDED